MAKRERASWMGLVVCAASASSACASSDEIDAHNEWATEGETLPEGTSANVLFDQAGQEHGVPPTLLKSIAWVETRMHMVDGATEFDGQEPRYGVMAIAESNHAQAAALAGVTPEDAKIDVRANVRSAAALLSLYADKLAIDRADLAAWAEPAAWYSGISESEALANYVHREIYQILRDGLFTEFLEVLPVDVEAKYPYAGEKAAGPDYPAAKWRPSPNISSRPSGTVGDPQMVIIHTCEGSYSGCWDHLTKSSSGVSAHYVVNSDGSEVSQLVLEAKKAWHISATYKCSRNDSTLCNLDGVSSNSFTIGIEHAGYASQGSWSNGLIDASAKLACNITQDNAIARDKWHLVAHGQLQPYNRTDPGPNWPWSSYLSKVNSFCGSNPTEPPPDQPPPDNSPGTIIVDSNQSLNPSNAIAEISGNWTASNNVGGYYNTGYFWRSTGATTDLARFKVQLASPKKMAVDAWWSSAGDRSTTAPFVIYDGTGAHIDTVYVNQRESGGQWVQLGTYNFTTGWNTVALSRWTTAGAVVVADAFRFREVP